MEFRAFEYVCAINDAKTISQAAKNLFISQPALSQYLTKTEAEVGTALFIRSGSELTPTVAGEQFIREGRLLLRERDRILNEIAFLSHAQVETLRFGISPFYSEYYLPLLYRYYQSRFPQIKLDPIERTSTQLEQMVLDGELNLCFIPSEPMREGLEYNPLYMEEILIGLPPNHPANHLAIAAPGRSYLDLTVLSNEPFVSLIPQLKFSTMHRRLMKHFSMKPNIVFRTSNWNTVCSLVASGSGVGLLPDVIAHRFPDSPIYYRIAGVDATRAYSAVYQKGRKLSQLEMNLISCFKEVLSNRKNDEEESE